MIRTARPHLHDDAPAISNHNGNGHAAHADLIFVATNAVVEKILNDNGLKVFSDSDPRLNNAIFGNTLVVVAQAEDTDSEDSPRWFDAEHIAMNLIECAHGCPCRVGVFQLPQESFVDESAAAFVQHVYKITTWFEDSTNPDDQTLKATTAAELVKRGPEMSPVIIDGALRIREILNIVSGAKSYKTYLLMSLLLSVASGKPWMGFKTHRQRVLLLDNELHVGTLRSRLRAVADAMSIDLNEVGDCFNLISLRGTGKDIKTIGGFLRGLKPNHYGIIAIDSFYRMIPAGLDENSNSSMTGLYNDIDGHASASGASIVLVHHHPKGDQSQKRIADLAAGAGAIGRAADSIVTIRPHAMENCAVLEMVVRSFPPMRPMVIQWKYPLWTPAPELNAADLQRDKSRRSSRPAKEPKKVWTVDEFVRAAVSDAVKSKDVVIAKAVTAGLSGREANHLLALAEDQQAVYRHSGTELTDKKIYFSTVKSVVSLTRARSPTPPQCKDTVGRGTVRVTKAKDGNNA